MIRTNQVLKLVCRNSKVSHLYQYGLCNARPQYRNWGRSVNTSTDDSPPPPPSEDKDTFVSSRHTGNTVTQDGKLLYLESQQFTVRIMSAITGINLTYWGSQVVMHQLFKDTVVSGVDLSGGDPLYSYIGLAATGLFLFFTRSYAHHAVYQCYESADERRIGFQVHTIFGFPGRKFEVAKGGARFVDPTNVTHLGSYYLPHSDHELEVRKAVEHNKSGKTKLMKRLFFSGSNVTVAVDGFNGNLLFDAHGNYLDGERLAKLLAPIRKDAPAELVDSALWDEKYQRHKWRTEKQRAANDRRNRKS